jgi:hypothetical protein
MPKKKKSDDKEEAINTSQSIFPFQHHHFLLLKNKLQIHDLPLGLWNKRMNSVKKSLVMYKKQKNWLWCLP